MSGIALAQCRGCKRDFIAEATGETPLFCDIRCEAAYTRGKRDAVEECVTVLVQVAMSAREKAKSTALTTSLVPRSRVFDAIARTLRRVAASLRGREQ